MTDLSTLDFDLIKNNLKSYLKEQKIFRDYDFEGSNINVLLDVLAYNSYLNGFYLNMIGNEMFLDSALLKDSVISHAKELGYIPRSFRSAVANINITLQDNNSASLMIPRGTSFTGTVGNKNFTFVTSENIPAQSTDAAGIFVANNVSIYEGDYVSDTFVVDYSNPTRYLLSNKTIDTTSILVTVLEDNGARSINYSFTPSLFDIEDTSTVYFLQAAENDRYEIVFGDGVIGRQPKDRSVVLVQYRACNGELPNGISVFAADGKINGATVVDIAVNESARSGAISESVSSIKFNAPRAFTTQERVVTANDYKSLLINEFPEINDVSAYGGEEANPPLFGKVVIAVDLNTSDELPPSRRSEYSRYVKQRSPLSIDPVFVKPDFTYINVDSKVRYNINNTQLTINDIRSIVESSIINFDRIFLNGFNKTLRYSRLVGAIDNSQIAIVSNDTTVTAVKDFVPNVNVTANYDIDFGIKLRDDISQLPEIHPEGELSVVHSTGFIFEGNECFLEDDGIGNLRIMGREGSDHILIQLIGSVNYETGFIQIENFSPQALLNNKISIKARTFDSDISSERKTVLRIRPQDINIDVEQVRV